MNFQIELTNLCNLSCVECPHVYMNRKKGQMSEEVFSEVLKKIVECRDLNTIILHKDGEPLLHSNIKGIIEQIVSVSDAKLDIYTNGLLLTQDFLDFLGNIKNNVSLFVSFHFYNKDGSKNDYTVCSNMFKNANISSNVHVVFVTHNTKFTNLSTLEEWRNDWLKLKSSLKFLKNVHVNQCINSWAGKVEEGNSFFDCCPYMDGEHLFIGCTGNVLACCMDLEEEIIFGNILTSKWKEILDNRNGFYSKLNNGIKPAPICNRCINK